MLCPETVKTETSKEESHSFNDMGTLLIRDKKLRAMWRGIGVNYICCSDKRSYVPLINKFFMFFKLARPVRVIIHAVKVADC